MSQQRLFIVGAGAVGMGLAVAAHNNGIGVSLLGRDGPLVRGQLRVGDLTLQARFQVPDVEPSLVVVATKSHDVDAALRSISTYADLPLLVLRNGMSSPPLSNRLATEGIVWGCCSRDAVDRVHWLGTMRIVVDADWAEGDLARLFLLNRWVDVAVADDIRAARYRKLMVNVGVNTLAALLRLDCSGLAKDAEAMNIAVTIAEEIAMLADVSGVNVGVDPAKHVREAVNLMGAFKPSMAQDIDARRKPETQALLDEPIRLGRELGVHMPALFALRARALYAWNYDRDDHA